MQTDQNILAPATTASRANVADPSSQSLDVVVIATLRPALLELTLHSFYKYFLSNFKTTRLILNVDPIGEPNVRQLDLLAIASRYADVVISRTPDTPSFAKAVEWGWSQVSTPLFLHLEDDWLLTKPVQWDAVSERFTNKASLASLRFNLTRNPNEDPPTHQGLSLNPCLWRTDFIRRILPHFDCSRDPEKQFRSSDGSAYPILSQWQFEYYGKPRERAYVIDTGKKWRRAHRLQKQTADRNMAAFWNQTAASQPFITAFYDLKYRLFLMWWRLRVGYRP